jgi:hypothetical protein
MSEVELLREYRTRLIADIVTGRFDLREDVARLPDESGAEGRMVGARSRRRSLVGAAQSVRGSPMRVHWIASHTLRPPARLQSHANFGQSRSP